MKKTVISLFTLILVVFTFATVTYSWLSLATVNVVDNISITAVKDTKLEISIDGINYSENLDSAGISNLIKDLRLQDVTSFDGQNFKFGALKSDKVATQNKDYLSVDLYFRTKSYETDVYLADNISKTTSYDNPGEGTYIISKGRNWIADLGFQYGKETFVNAGEIVSIKASDAMRISFTEKKVNENDSKETFISKIFDLSEDPERGYGKTYGAVDYYNRARNENLVPPSVVPDTVYKLSEFEVDAPFAKDERSKIITLNKLNETDDYHYGKATMNIWIEGWDADVINAIYGEHIKIQLKFKAVRPN